MTIETLTAIIEEHVANTKHMIAVRRAEYKEPSPFYVGALDGIEVELRYVEHILSILQED